jgi:NAD(P)-dependent dehydrogenase (short-subunit alcohol dehydrogenase family)
LEFTTLKGQTFKDKVVIVTGSSRGIGRATAQRLACSGAAVVLNGRNTTKLENTRIDMEKKGYTVFGIPGDVTSIKESKNLIEKTIERFGTIDVLINNAGIVSRGKFEDLKPDVFRKVVEGNLLGSVYTTMFALPYLKRTEGSIVFISSLAALRGFPIASPYSASKMGLTALAESLRIELAETGIHVCIIYVGFTENDPEKRVLSADGTMIHVDTPFRVPQEKTADWIVQSIVKKKFKAVLTPLGKLSSLAQRLAPRLVELTLKYSYKKMERLYH